MFGTKLADFEFCWSALLLSEIHIALQFTEIADLEFHWSALLLSEIYMAWHFTKISHFNFRDRLFLIEIRIFIILWRLIVWVLRSRNVWHKIGWFWNLIDRLLNRFCFYVFCIYLFIYLGVPEFALALYRRCSNGTGSQTCEAAASVLYWSWWQVVMRWQQRYYTTWNTTYS